MPQPVTLKKLKVNGSMKIYKTFSWESLGWQGDPTSSFWRRAVLGGRNDAKAETPILWPPHEKSWLIGKDPDAGRDWRQEKKGTVEDEMAGWHHQLNGHEFGWTPGIADGQGGLACCDSWGCRVRHDWASELNWTEQSDINNQYPNDQEAISSCVFLLEARKNFGNT